MRLGTSDADVMTGHLLGLMLMADQEFHFSRCGSPSAVRLEIPSW